MCVHESITCKELTDFLMEYLDDELDTKRRALFDQHLSICPSCVKYLATYRKTVELGKDAFRSDPDARANCDVPEGLVRAIIAARRV